MRLQKFLARAGAASRRGSEDLMTAGRVTVNGLVVTELGAKVDPALDEVSVDGRRVTLADGPTYLMLNKPGGVVTTMSDPHGRPTVAELVPSTPGLFPVGRLDLDTTGLLLFTTDGELAHRLLHPRRHVPKTYQVLVDGTLVEREVAPLRSGIELDDGPTKPAEVRIGPVREGGGSEGRDATEVEITISEGRKRQVKRMFSVLGHPVLALHRTAFGPLELGTLGAGEVRALTPDEIRQLTAAVEEG